MSKVKEHWPSPDSREPVRATGLATAMGALVTVLAVRLLGLDAEVALGLGAVLGPIVTAEVARRWAYAPATVAQLLAVRGGRER